MIDLKSIIGLIVIFALLIGNLVYIFIKMYRVHHPKAEKIGGIKVKDLD